MKSLSHFLACIGVLSLFTVGCEKHDFETTKILHEAHGGEHHDDEHKEGHEGDHKKDEDHANGHEEKDGGEEETKKEEGRDVGI